LGFEIQFPLKRIALSLRGGIQAYLALHQNRFMVSALKPGPVLAL